MNVALKEVSNHVDLSQQIRDLTAEEIATFQRDGWVYAPNFINPALCDEVIDHFMKWSGLRWREWPKDPAEQQAFVAAIEGIKDRPKKLFAIRQSDPWMFNYITQRQFGKAAAELLKVPSIKPFSETLHLKFPQSSGHSRELVWHQDEPCIPIDRAQAVQLWTALGPISEDMGQMVHLTGSHREPPGGMVGLCNEDAVELYPEIFEKYPLSKPKPLKAGDAIFHHVLTWHKSYENMTDKVRWAMSSIRMSSRCRYTGQQNFNTDGLGLAVNEQFNHPNFPTVYP